MISNKLIIKHTIGAFSREHAITEDGAEWTRRGQNDTWRALQPSNSTKRTMKAPNTPSASESDSTTTTKQPSTGGLLEISVVLFDQGPGQEQHWGPFVAHEGQPGDLHQALGDHTHMTYSHVKDLNIFAREDYADAVVLASFNKDQAENMTGIGREAAEKVPPPHANNMREATGTCQTWVINVLEELAHQGVVSQSKIREAENRISTLSQQRLAKARDLQHQAR